WLREAVRGVLEPCSGYQALSAQDRRSLAQGMVKVSAMAATLIAQEHEAQDEIAQTQAPTRPAPLARAQEQPGFGAAAERIADTTRNVLGAVSFPRFVTDLINGVFHAMLDSSSQQMRMYVE